MQIFLCPPSLILRRTLGDNIEEAMLGFEHVAKCGQPRLALRMIF